MISGITVDGDNYRLSSSSLIAPMVVLPSASSEASGQYVMVSEAASVELSAKNPTSFSFSGKKSGELLFKASQVVVAEQPYNFEEIELMIKQIDGSSEVLITYRDELEDIRGENLIISLH